MFAGYPAQTSKVGGLIDGYGAKAAGLRAADKITAINAIPVDTWEEMQKQIQESKNKSSIAVSLIRNNQKLEFDVALKSRVLDNQLGEKKTLGIIGTGLLAVPILAASRQLLFFLKDKQYVAADKNQ